MSIDQRANSTTPTNPINPANPYDATYYRVGCGVPYERNAHWLTFFARIADAIVREINPSSVLDAGCAMGFLVEALRQRGVEAYGMDISEYAIAQVAEEIKPYCWVGDLTQPAIQARHYDLVICIETLEHLRAEDLPTALRTLCDAADDILFSSTPDDYSEATHFSVQPPEHWASLFAARNFWHDAEFDASFLTPWAMRFRKSSDPAPRAIIPLERALWRLRRENRALRALVNTAREDGPDGERASASEPAAAPPVVIPQQEPFWSLLRQAFDTASASAQAQAQRRELVALSVENASLRADLARASTQLSQLTYVQQIQDARLSYKLARGAIHSIDLLLLPEGSRRRGLYRRASHAIRGQRSASAPADDATLDAEAEEAGLPFAVVAARAAARASLPYDEWLRDATPSRAEQALRQRAMARWTTHPTISLLMPVYDPPIHALRDAIESVMAQSYPHWELCVVDGGSQQPEIAELIALYARRDPRIKARRLERNLGIAGNTNAAAELATGEFLLLFDHDDTIEPYTLFAVASALHDDPTLDIIYFDEDKLAADGSRREEPFFKPDWSPELLLCVNYLTHPVLRRSLYHAVGGCDAAFDGAQDWDLLLKATERSQRIHHIAQPLYHWRKSPASAAGAVAAKPYVFARQRQAVADHLRRAGIADGQAVFTEDGRLRVTWPITPERVSIIIPTKDKRKLLEQCIESLLTQTRYDDYEIILVDTGSVEPATLAYYDALKQRPELRDRLTLVEYTGPFNYSRANNLGASRASGSLLLFLNNDTEIIAPDWLEELARWAQRPEIGVVGAQLLFPGGQIQHAGVVMGMGGHAGHIFAGLEAHTPTIFGSPDWYRDYMAVTGACLMTRREVFERVGGFDEGYQLAFSDVEYCLRARAAGFKTIYTPFAQLKHHESASRGLDIPLGDIQRGFERMIALVEQGDPYFNPNLASGYSAPTLALNDASIRAERLRQIVRRFEFVGG